MKARNITSWVLRLVAAFIMLQTLYFKFSAAPESIYIFTQVGMEPWGRIGTGVAELIASILLLIPATIVIGALLAIGVMLGAIVVHLFILGVEVQGDGGQLFAYAIMVMIASVVLLVMHREQLAHYRKILFKV
ncbi:MAG: DoxX family protein [Bacteroidota bacterium]